MVARGSPRRREGAPGRRVTSPAVWWVWLLIRIPGALSLALLWPRAYARREASDLNLYRHWSSELAHGLLPYRDFHVEYPPGVLALMVLPPLHAATAFRIEFVVLAVMVDAAALRALLRAGRHALGCWMWVAAPVALGPIVWARLDIFVAAAVIAGVLCVERDRPLRAGVWLAVAALIKVWPLLLVAAFAVMVSRGRGREVIGGAAATVVAFVLPVLGWGGWSGLRWMVQDQLGRGVQIESMLAVPLFLAQRAGLGYQVAFAHGAHEIVGRWAGGIALAGTLVMLASAFAVVFFVRRRREPPAAIGAVTLILVVIVIVTGKVLSPQYLLWAVAAVAVSIDSVARPRLLFCWTIVALVATQLDYPLLYSRLAEAGRVGTAISLAHAVAILGFGFVSLSVAVEVFARLSRPEFRGGSGRDTPGPTVAIPHREPPPVLPRP